MAYYAVALVLTIAVGALVGSTAGSRGRAAPAWAIAAGAGALVITALGIEALRLAAGTNAAVDRGPSALVLVGVGPVGALVWGGALTAWLRHAPPVARPPRGGWKVRVDSVAGVPAHEGILRIEERHVIVDAADLRVDLMELQPRRDGETLHLRWPDEPDGIGLLPLLGPVDRERRVRAVDAMVEQIRLAKARAGRGG